MQPFRRSVRWYLCLLLSAISFFVLLLGINRCVQWCSPSISLKLQRMDHSYTNGSDRSVGLEWTTDVHEERRMTLMNICNTWHRIHRKNIGGGGLLQHFAMDRKHGLVYCDIPKVGSSFWKRVLQITSGKKKESSPFNMPAGSAHDGTLEVFIGKDFDQIHQILLSSTKFLFVREPYSRLFSCYLDKIFTPRSEYLKLRRHVLTVSRGKQSNDDANRRCALHVTFSDFFKFVIYSVEKGIGANDHFLPMYDICRPCEIQYDIVGKMETFMNDARFILKQKGLENRIELNQEQSDTDAIADLASSVFTDRRGIEKCLSFGEGLSIVWKKAIIRGLLSREEIMPQRFLLGRGFSEGDFKNAMNEAYKRSTDTIGRLNNRKTAIAEAYGTISREDLEKYRELFRSDFNIFGYELEPADIFSPNVSKTEQSFF